MIYNWNYEEPDAKVAEEAAELAAAARIHPALGRLLHERGMRTPAEVTQFFRPQLTTLHDPFLMNDMDKAVDRLNEAMGKKERILVYGDYDVDGCTAVALVYKFLRQYYSHIDYYIPDRYDEGYGISHKSIEMAAESGVKLVIVLDCGIKAVEEIAYAKSLGVDFIICDHHVPDDVLPEAAAILNPKRHDNHYPYTELSGCGVGFKFMQAFALNNGIEFNKLTSLLDLCAVSIASDIVPVMGENRILAYHGLRCLNSNPSIGLRAIVEVCGLTERELTMNDIVFKIGPRINASGRMQNGKEAVELLVEKDYPVALEKAHHINVYNAVQSCEELLENFGGHTYAAGLTLKVENVEEFSERFEAYVASHILEEQTKASIDIHAILDFKDVNFRFYQQLKRFAPFGPMNEKPVFCTKKVYDYGTSKVVGRGQEHIKLELVDDKSNHVMNGIAFGQSSQARYIKTRQSFDICYTIEENTHKRGDIQLQIIDIRPRTAEK